MISPRLAVLAAVGVCTWITAIGPPIAHAAFGAHARMVWPFFAPVVGIAAVLLTTNLAAYAISGTPAAWAGLMVPAVLSVLVAWRSRALARLSRRSISALLALAIASIGVFVLALANRTQV